MKLAEAQKLIEKHKPGGEGRYLVHFDERVPSGTRGDFFPDVQAGEEPLTWEEARLLARQFADATSASKYPSIYLIDARTFVPVRFGEIR